MFRKILALTLAFLCAALAIPSVSFARERVQSGDAYSFEDSLYSASDVAILQAFLEADGNGILINPAYSVENPRTFGVKWEEIGGVLRAISADWQSLQISGDLSLAGLDCLQSFSCSSNRITALDLSGCQSLTTLYCDANQIASLNLSGCALLTDLYADNNQLTAIDLTGCAAICSLFVSSNRLDTLSLIDLPELELVQCDNNVLTSITVKGCPALETLYCQDNNLPFLNLSGCAALKTLCAQNNLLLAVNLMGCQQLSILKLTSNRLTALPDLTACVGLTPDTADFSDNGFDEDDLAPLPDSLLSNPVWVEAQVSGNIYVTSEGQPVLYTAPEYDLSTLGNVLTNRQGTVFPYDASAVREEEGWALVISAQPNNGKYHQRNLSFSQDQLTQLREAGFFQVALQVGDVAIYVPIASLLHVGGANVSSLSLLVAPLAEDEWSDSEKAVISSNTLLSSACRYRLAGGADNATGLLDGLRVRISVPATEDSEDLERLRIFLVSRQESTMNDVSRYVPSCEVRDGIAIYTVDLSGAGNGMVGLILSEN